MKKLFLILSVCLFPSGLIYGAACGQFAINPTTGKLDCVGTGSGGGGTSPSTLAVTTGSAAGFGNTVSSPTAVIVFDSQTTKGQLTGTATYFFSLDNSSVTTQGVLVAGSNITLTPGTGKTTIAASGGGSGISTINQLTNGATNFAFAGALTTINTNTSGATNFIYLQDTLQTGATFYVSSGTVQGTLKAGFFSGDGSLLTNIANTALDTSSVTKQGVLVAGTNITLTPGSGITTIASSGGGSGINTINQLTNGATNFAFAGALTTINLLTSGATNFSPAGALVTINANTSGATNFALIGTPTGQTLAVTTGTLAGFQTVISSPTNVINFDSATVKGALVGGSTFFFSLNNSSVTTQGVLVAGNNITLSPGTGITTIATGNSLSTINQVTSGATNFAFAGALTTINQQTSGATNFAFVGALTTINSNTSGATNFALIGTPTGQTLAVTTGTLAGFQTVVSSPTNVINFDSATVKGALVGGSTFFFSLNNSSVTTQGVLVAGNNITLTPGTGITTVATGNSLSTINQQTSGATNFAFVGALTTINQQTSGATNFAFVGALTTINSNTSGATNFTLIGTTSGQTLAVTTGTLAGFQTVISSPTNVIVFDSATIKGALVGGSTFFFSLSVTSVTTQGVLVAGNNITLTPGTGITTIASNAGSGINTINTLTNGATNFIQQQSSLQSGATFYVSSGTVNGQFTSYGPEIVQSSSTLAVSNLTTWKDSSGNTLDSIGSTGLLTTSSTTVNDNLTVTRSLYISTGPTKAGNYTMTNADTVIFASATRLSTYVITLPTAANNAGKTIMVFKIDKSSYPINIKTQNAELIGNTTIQMVLNAPGQEFSAISDGTAWYTISFPKHPPYVGSPHDPNSALALAATNDAHCQAYELTDYAVFQGVAFANSAASGNMDVGIYDNLGNRLGSAGATAVPAAGVHIMNFTAPAFASPGIVWVCFSAASTSSTFTRNGSDVTLGECRFTSAQPLPTNFTFPGCTQPTGSRDYDLAAVVYGGTSQ